MENFNGGIMKNSRWKKQKTDLDALGKLDGNVHVLNATNKLIALREKVKKQRLTLKVLKRRVVYIYESLGEAIR
jgi:hypothetical protein